MDVSAVAVVLGATVVMGTAAIDEASEQVAALPASDATRGRRAPGARSGRRRPLRREPVRHACRGPRPAAGTTLRGARTLVVRQHRLRCDRPTPVPSDSITADISCSSPPSYRWPARTRCTVPRRCRGRAARRRTMARVKVSTRGDYASRALLSLALHDDDGPTSVRDIAERPGLPQPYLEQILLALKGAGLVRSKRGVGGGYVLARARRGHPAGPDRLGRRRPDPGRRFRRAPHQRGL